MSNEGNGYLPRDYGPVAKGVDTDWQSPLIPLTRVDAGSMPEVMIGGTRDYAMSLIGNTLEVRNTLGGNGDYKIIDVTPVGGGDEATGWRLVLERKPDPTGYLDG